MHTLEARLFLSKVRHYSRAAIMFSFTTAEILGALRRVRSVAWGCVLRAPLSKSHRFGELIRGAVAGTDCTDAFYNLHRQEVLQKYSSLCIGQIEGEQSKVIEHKPGDLSVIPYGEPTWLSPQFKSPYYNESHRRLQKAMRIFTDEELYPIAQECEKTGKHIPQGLIDSMSEKGILHMRIGPGKHLHGVNLMNGAVSSVARFSPLPRR
jgi:hypothetical protein